MSVNRDDGDVEAGKNQVLAGEASAPAEASGPTTAEGADPSLPTGPPKELDGLLPSEPPPGLHAHPCPSHAAWPVLGPCPRCGKFFCARCLTESGYVFAPLSKQCADCEKLTPLLPPIGGWLLLPALHVGLLGPVTQLIAVVKDVQALAKGVQGPLIAPILCELLFWLAYLSFTSYAAVAFFRKRRRAQLLMLGFYALGLMSIVVSQGLVEWVSSLTGVPSASSGTLGLRGGVAYALWMVYFVQSKQVRKTFIAK